MNVDQISPKLDHILSHKWLYILLKYIYENRAQIEDPLGAVEEVYTDFDYPIEIESFVRYMPSDDLIESNYNSNVSKLMSKWLDFIKRNDKIYLSSTNQI